MKNLFYSAVLMILFCGFAMPQAEAQTIVVPNANTDIAGGSNNSFPFDSGNPIRYQQIYASSQLQQCGKIIEISFRNDLGFGGDGGTVTYPDITVQLSTTSATPDSLSETFADNIGPNVQTVYNGELTFTSPECLVEPCPFVNRIVLQEPFIYNPGQGDLLLDVTERTGELYVTFDALDESPFMERLWNDTNINDETGTIAGSVGLVTQFVCEPVVADIPTLSEWGLIAMAGFIGLAGLIAVRRKKVQA